MTKEEYMEFMSDPDNEFKCTLCPENRGCDDWQIKHPCGQDFCWVTYYCAFKGGAG